MTTPSRASRPFSPFSSSLALISPAFAFFFFFLISFLISFVSHYILFIYSATVPYLLFLSYFLFLSILGILQAIQSAAGGIFHTVHTIGTRSVETLPNFTTRNSIYFVRIAAMQCDETDLSLDGFLTYPPQNSFSFRIIFSFSLGFSKGNRT